ncbi:hypothetical protein L484_026330 [Morus notabilis]|uniref:Uncharacterized protein n=1 Tax=Morus notabilis TaxID=981085 RepID=W9QY52_9ROSA|nr:hypothetical protein L484_026330 [Morus notabilis]
MARWSPGWVSGGGALLVGSDGAARLAWAWVAGQRCATFRRRDEMSAARPQSLRASARSVEKW